MNYDRRKKTKGLLCTCNDLHIDDICESIYDGANEPEEVMHDHGTMFRCVECKPIIEKLIDKKASDKEAL